MENNNIDWSNLDFSYRKTNMRYVSNYTNGAWDSGIMTEDDTITMSECAGVLQYAQTVFEGLKAYTTEDGRIVTFRLLTLMLTGLRIQQNVLRCLYFLKTGLLMLLKK